MRYNPALDGIRALAVLAVVAHHAFVPGFGNGRAGVDVFFVLSGFLITSLLVAEQQAGGIRLGAFYLRRARRLYPALLLMLALYLALAPWLYPDAENGKDALVAALYLTDYAYPLTGHPAHLSHTWSLAVEEHFYLLWPLAVMGLLRLPNAARITLLALLYCVVTWWRYQFFGLFTESYFYFHTHCSGLLLGSILAFVPTSRWWGLAVLPLGWWAFASYLPVEMVITQSEWMGAAVVLWAASGQAKPLTWRPLVFLGKISYGIYLFHWIIVEFYRIEGYTWAERLWPSLAGSVCLAILSYYGIERWFRTPSKARPQLAPHAEPAGDRV